MKGKDIAIGIFALILVFLVFVRAGNKKQSGAQEAATIINAGSQGFVEGVKALQGR